MKLAIATSANEIFIPAVIALYNSVQKNAKVKADFHLLAHGNISAFINLPDDIHIHLNKETIASPTSPNWPEELPAMYSRLLIPELFTDYDRVLYIDADCLVLDSLEELFNADLEGYACAGCLPGGPYNPVETNYLQYQFVNEAQYVRFKDINAIQSGVVLFDIEQWNKLSLSTIINKILVSPIKFKFVVQGVLGYALLGNFKVLDYRWNYYTNWAKRKGSLTDINILHFVGDKKPWAYSTIEYHTLWASYFNKE
jgi:lipopolysaccharide biosynthesis glycosyltransferase